MNGTPRFRNVGAIWQAGELYYFSVATGIRYQRDVKHLDMFRVVYPDGSLSVDCYNLARVRQHCLDIAHTLYPRLSNCGVTTAPISMAGGPESHPTFNLGRGEYQTTPDTKPSTAATADGGAGETESWHPNLVASSLGPRR